MFPSQDGRQDGKRKRVEEDWVNASDLIRPEEKKLRPLPFRTSPTSKHVNPYLPHQRPPRSVPATITPVESSEDESPGLVPDDQDQEDPSSQATSGTSLEVRVTDDEDMEMSDSQPHNILSPIPWMTVSDSSPPATHTTPSHPTLSVSGGRIATPIYGHFAPDVAMDTTDDMVVHSGSEQSVLGEEESRWRKARRLPSPISEDEDADSMLSPKSKPRMASHLEPPSRQGDGTAPLLTLPTEGRRVGSGGSHRRIGSYDARTGITTTFSMGYRADCEKCVMKVPGHYAHIIREKTGVPEQENEDWPR